MKNEQNTPLCYTVSIRISIFKNLRKFFVLGRVEREEVEDISITLIVALFLPHHKIKIRQLFVNTHFIF